MRWYFSETDNNLRKKLRDLREAWTLLRIRNQLFLYNGKSLIRRSFYKERVVRCDKMEARRVLAWIYNMTGTAAFEIGLRNVRIGYEGVKRERTLRLGGIDRSRIFLEIKRNERWMAICDR